MDPPEKEGQPPVKATVCDYSGTSRTDIPEEEDQPQPVQVYEGIPIASTTGPITISHIDPYTHFTSSSGSNATGKGPRSGSSNCSRHELGEDFLHHERSGSGDAFPIPNDDRWGSSLFSCFSEPQSTLDIVLCSYCNLSSQANMLMNNKRGIHYPLCFGMACVDYFCFAGACSCVSFCAVNVVVRQAIRHRYNLKTGIGKMVKDIVAGTCCALCALCQQHREMSRRGDWPGCILVGFDPADVRPSTHVNIE